MSIPIISCRVFKASKSDRVLNLLALDLMCNIMSGHFSTLPCNHNPKCEEFKDDEQARIFSEKIAERMGIFGEKFKKSNMSFERFVENERLTINRQQAENNGNIS